MSKIFDLLVFKIQHFNPSNPLDVIDAILALGFLGISLAYLSRFPVFRVILGVLFLSLLTVIGLLLNLFFTSFIIGLGTAMVVVALPLIFSPEIRHYLEKLGRFSFVRVPSVSQSQRKSNFIRNLVGAVYELAERKIGALIVITRGTGLGETIETGVIIDAKFGSKLLATIFTDKSPLHDGAVVIKDERILAAGCLLPIHGEVKLDPPFGTRHKSGLAITQDTDALSIIISEQRGEVSLAENGKLELNLDRVNLTERLQKLL